MITGAEDQWMDSMSVSTGDENLLTVEISVPMEGRPRLIRVDFLNI
jgi:hypothetical protein